MYPNMGYAPYGQYAQYFAPQNMPLYSPANAYNSANINMTPAMAPNMVQNMPQNMTAQNFVQPMAQNISYPMIQPAGYLQGAYNLNTQAPQLQPQLQKDTFQMNTTQGMQPEARSSIKTSKTKPTKLSLFFINDMHGHLDNMTNILGASRQYDKDVQKNGSDSIKLSAGDNFAGADVKKNSLMLQFLNYIGIEASAMGNHEYDATATSLYDIAGKQNTKFLAANARTPDGSKFYDNIQKSMVVEKNGSKYGIVGLMPVDLETVASRTEALEGIKPFTLQESVQMAQAEVDKLREQGINKIILISHLGIDKDKEIAPMLDGVDIIQGGHSHNLTDELKKGENVVKSKTGEPVVIVQGGENGKYAGILDVQFDENGIITDAALNINKAELEKSPVLEYIKSATLGPSPKAGILVASEPLPENRRTTPCAWTNFMCDAMRSEMNTDLAFVNAANTRKVPKAGILTERDVSESTPLKNTLLTTTMTEKEVVRVIKDALDMSLAKSKTGEPGIMHVSGLEYKATYDGKLLEMNFVDKNGNKTPIDINNPSDDKTYSVCCDSFVTDPRENPEYPGMLLSNHKFKEAQHFDFDKDKVTLDYIKKLPNKEDLSITDDHRIQIIEQDGSIRDVKNQ